MSPSEVSNLCRIKHSYGCLFWIILRILYFELRTNRLDGVIPDRLDVWVLQNLDARWKCNRPDYAKMTRRMCNWLKGESFSISDTRKKGVRPWTKDSVVTTLVLVPFSLQYTVTSYSGFFGWDGSRGPRGFMVDSGRRDFGGTISKSPFWYGDYHFSCFS